MFVSVIRTTLLYFIIVAGLRIMGKRQISEMQPTELVCTILISNIATLPIEDANIPFLAGVIPILTIICLEVFMAVFAMKSRTVETIVGGNSCIVIKDGVIDQKVLRDLRITADDLLCLLHQQEVFDPREVAFAVLETTGKLSLFKKDGNSAGTDGSTQNDGSKNKQTPLPPMPVIINGCVVHSNLEYCKIDGEWIKRMLKNKEDTKIRDVFLLLLTPKKEYHLIRKESKN